MKKSPDNNDCDVMCLYLFPFFTFAVKTFRFSFSLLTQSTTRKQFVPYANTAMRYCIRHAKFEQMNLIKLYRIAEKKNHSIEDVCIKKSRHP